MKRGKAQWISYIMAGGVRVIFCFFAVVLLGLSLISIQMPDKLQFLNSKWELMTALLAGSITLFCLFYLWMYKGHTVQKLVSQRIPKLNQKKQFVSCIVAGMVVIVLLQLVYIVFLRIELRYDSLEVFEEACNLLKTGQISYWDYFGTNAHQRGTLYMTWGLLKLAQSVGVPSTAYVLYLDLWCMLFVDVTLVMTGFCIWHSRKHKGVLCFLLICLLNPFTYLWCGFYYTTIQCLPFMAMLACVVYIFPRCHKVWHTIVLAFVFALSCYIGKLIRATVLIGLVALAIYVVAGLLNCNKQEEVIRKIKKGSLFAAVFVAVFLCAGGCYNAFDQKMVTIDSKGYERPALFWAAMAAKGDGTWDGNDAEYLAKFPTYEEKQEAAVSLLKSRLSAMDVSGYFELAANKLRVTWAEGNDDAISENASSLSYGTLYDYLLGDRSQFFLVYCQIFRVFTFAMVLVSCFCSFQKQKFDVSDYMKLVVLGGILFHILWEAKRLYSIPFMPFLLILMNDGICIFGEETENTVSAVKHLSKHKVLTWLQGMAALLTVILLVCNFSECTQEKRTRNTFVASQLMERCDIKKGLFGKEAVRQEFFADRPFNTIGVEVRNYSWYYGEENQSVYRLTVTNQMDEMLREAYIYGKDFEDYEFCDTTFEEIVPKKGGELYRFTIEPVKAEGNSYLVFYKKAASAIDPYPWGSYVENGVLMENADLTFRAYQKEDSVLCSETAYFFGGLFLVFVQIFQIYLLSRKKKMPI